MKVVFCHLLCLGFPPNLHSFQLTAYSYLLRGTISQARRHCSFLCFFFVALRGILPNEMLVEAEQEILLRILIPPKWREEL